MAVAPEQKIDLPANTNVSFEVSSDMRHEYQHYVLKNVAKFPKNGFLHKTCLDLSDGRTMNFESKSSSLHARIVYAEGAFKTGPNGVQVRVRVFERPIDDYGVAGALRQIDVDLVNQTASSATIEAEGHEGSQGPWGWNPDTVVKFDW